jgi:hypothetical protein
VVSEERRASGDEDPKTLRASISLAQLKYHMGVLEKFSLTNRRF